MNPAINITKDGFLEIEHPTLGPPQTRLAADVAASATSSTVENYDDFATNDIVVFGAIGQELTEAVTLTSVTANVTLGHTTGPVFAHSARDPVAKVLFNQAEIYTSTTESGTYALLATVTLNFNKERTTYNASAQASTTWFKVRYKDSVTTAYSSYSDTVEYTNWTSQSLGEMTNEILEEFEDPDAKETSRVHVRRLLRAGVRHLALDLIKHYPEFRKQYTTQTLTSGTATYDYPDGFLGFFRVDVNYNNSTYSEAYKVNTFESEAEGDPNTTYYKGDPRLFFRDTAWGLRPTPDNSSGTAFLWYWSYPDEMSDEGDTHGLPYGAKDVLIAYALYRLWLGKNEARSTTYRSEYLDSRARYVEFIGQQRQTISRPIVQAVFGGDLYDDAPSY